MQMRKKNKGWLNIFGLVVFLLSLPLFFRMGGGEIAMAEVLPGQAETGGLSFSALFQKEETKVVSANVIGTDAVEFSPALAISGGGQPLWVTAEELEKMKDPAYLRSR